jgi:hypothetical protein
MMFALLVGRTKKKFEPLCYQTVQAWKRVYTIIYFSEKGKDLKSSHVSHLRSSLGLFVVLFLQLLVPPALAHPLFELLVVSMAVLIPGTARWIALILLLLYFHLLVFKKILLHHCHHLLQGHLFAPSVYHLIGWKPLENVKIKH